MTDTIRPAVAVDEDLSDDIVTTSTGLRPISEAPAETEEASAPGLTPDEDAGDGWIATDVEL